MENNQRPPSAHINPMLFPGVIHTPELDVVDYDESVCECVIQKTKEYFNIQDIHRYTRKRPYPDARCVAIYLIHILTKKMTLIEIGTHFPRVIAKNKVTDHASVIWAIKRIQRLMHINDPIISPAIETIKKNIQSSLLSTKISNLKNNNNAKI